MKEKRRKSAAAQELGNLSWLARKSEKEMERIRKMAELGRKIKKERREREGVNNI